MIQAISRRNITTEKPIEIKALTVNSGINPQHCGTVQISYSVPQFVPQNGPRHMKLTAQTVDKLQPADRRQEIPDTYEPDTHKRVLSIKKQNYGETGAEIGLTWRDGVFVPDATETSLDRMSAAAKAERVFLKLLRMFTDQGRTVRRRRSASRMNCSAAVRASALWNCWNRVLTGLQTRKRKHRKGRTKSRGSTA